MNWKEDYKRKLTTAEEAAKAYESGDHIGVGGGTGIPTKIVDAIGRRAGEITDVKFGQGFAVGLHEYMKPEHKDHFRIETIFIGPAERLCLDWGTCDFVPNHLGSMIKWATDFRVDKLAAVVSPPDENGYMNRSLFAGLVPDQLVKKCKYIAVEVNENTPWLFSDNDVFNIHVSEVDAIVENHETLFEIPEIPITDVEKEIARHIVDMIPDGSTVQLGLGGLANCIGHFLKDKKRLGIHSEVFTDSIMELMKCGVADGSNKSLYPGKVVYTFAVGTHKLHKFLHRNPDCIAFEIEKTNDPYFIAENNDFVSINNALMVDLTGQVASESIGTRQFSATGGQVNFVLGSQMAEGGRSFISLPSTRVDSKGKVHSRILDVFPPGTITTTSRNDVEWIVTEHGAVRLTNKSISERVKLLVSIAHPDFRDELLFKARQHKWI
ncbi:MAG TPA: acetyl-CoA hydrolase/transferase C-terminal domain-containing protein [Syntrophomonadaceae bacterium]|nr:acetyl-CoA hydrolase/transferase C-terminal domain-containing protein [Syntrophomonadaceae bacterium]